MKKGKHYKMFYDFQHSIDMGYVYTSGRVYDLLTLLIWRIYAIFWKLGLED